MSGVAGLSMIDRGKKIIPFEFWNALGGVT